MDPTDRDARVFALYEQLLEIEQRLIRTGLLRSARPSWSCEQIDLSKLVASFDRPEYVIRAVPPELVDAAIREFVRNGSEAAIRLLEGHGLDPDLTRPVFALLETVSDK